MDDQIVNKHFEKYAAHWVESSYEGDGYIYPTARHRVRIVTAHLARQGRPLKVADLGCGAGKLSIALAQAGHTVVGLDQSANMLAMAEEARCQLPPGQAARLSFHRGDLKALDDSLGRFDVVVAMGVIGYMPEDAVLCEAARRLLLPGGLMLVSCRNRLFNMNSLSFRTVKEIESGDARALIEESQSYCQEVGAEAAAVDVDEGSFDGVVEPIIAQSPVRLHD